MNSKLLRPKVGKGFWPTMEDGTPVITQSMVSTFVSCPREIYYGIVLGLRPRLEQRPLTRGTWVHALLEERANGGDWETKHAELYEKALPQQFDEEVDDLANECYDIMSSYAWVYQDDDLTPIAAELTVERPVFDGRVMYRGRIDLIVQDKHGDVWIVDHKTHKSFPDWHYRELSFQHYSYLWACRKAPQYLALGIPQPKGFIYDYAKTSTIKRPTLTSKGTLSRTLKTQHTTYPVFTKWLRDNNLLTTVAGRDLLAIEDDAEREYVEGFMEELRTRDYSHLFRRDKMEFSLPQQKRQIKMFLRSAERMLKYDWTDPDTIERGSHLILPCRYADLSLADLMHGSSAIEQKTRYTVTEDPLDYYPNQKRERKKK